VLQCDTIVEKATNIQPQLFVFAGKSKMVAL
jgi:hypothetical protein